MDQIESSGACWGIERIKETRQDTVTIPIAEYRELCGKAALWDEYRADVERWCEGGDA